jgi:hypothetical protein
MRPVDDRLMPAMADPTTSWGSKLVVRPARQIGMPTKMKPSTGGRARISVATFGDARLMVRDEDRLKMMPAELQ